MSEAILREEKDADCKKRRLAEAVARLIKFGETTFKPYKSKQRNLCMLRDGLRRHLARERTRRRGRAALVRFAGVAIQARARANSTGRMPRLSTALASMRALMCERARHEEGRMGRVARRVRRSNNVMTSNVIGPVLRDVLAGFEMRGDG